MSIAAFPLDKLLVILGNVLFILFLGDQLFKRSPETSLKQHFWFAFSLKIFAGIALGLVYKFYYTSGDTFSLFRDSVRFSSVAFQNFGEYLNLLFSNGPISIESSLENHNARAVFMAKILSIPNLLTLQNYWLTTWYCSFFSFFGIWKCANTLERLFKKHHLEIAMAFFYFPSVLFWTSGILKESISIGSICLLISLTLNFLHPGRKKAIYEKGLSIFIILLCLLVIWKLKYYYFAVLSPCLLAYTLTICFERFNTFNQISNKLKFVILFSGIILAATLAHPNLNLEKFLNALVKNNELMAEQTEKKENLIQFTQLNPNIQSIVFNTPKAVIEGLFRPYIWEKGNLQKKLSSIESSFLLILILINTYYLADKSIWNKKGENNLLLLASIFYIGIMLIFLSLASPNIGNLVRYQTGFKPFLVAILLSVSPIPQWATKLLKKEKWKI
ncbi:hypothetical protein [Flexithrix dorotheae]|uniref:hypothetical protein n=1 Tax=Flexithrix dorotheae TaxID=70993 RepID=UPI000376DAF0|nr:hypothetical protein [Flexithrix dorotheae]